MSRPLRIEFTGAVYHITSRGNIQKSRPDPNSSCIDIDGKRPNIKKRR